MIFPILIVTIVASVNGHNYTLEEIRSWKIPENILKAFPSYYCGLSYDKSPVWYTPNGKWDIRSLVDQGQEQIELYKKYMIKIFQNNVDSARNASQGIVAIVDMDGYDIRQTAHAATLLLHIWGMQEWAKFVQHNSIMHAFVLNTNFIYKSIYDSSARIFGNFQNVVEMYGTNPNTWKPRLLKLIPADQLPEALGGTLKECTPLESFASFVSIT